MFFPGALVRCAPTRLIFSLHIFAPLLRSGIVSKKLLDASSSTKLGPLDNWMCTIDVQRDAIVEELTGLCKFTLNLNDYCGVAS